MSSVISVENLSKSYRLGQIGTGTLTNDLKVWWAKLRGKPNPLLKIGQSDHGSQNGETVWALKDVSFQVEQGEVLGIIGRNGAGKSTLLKILSRVTAPTSGQVKVKGRIASLLEVGTGFHPELTGRENIYLNGAILGMSKEEVRRKFDEIVAFAEVEKFIDTPVKRYSSGMYVRLAFAVAAHLESEILLVDEVLAVGDSEFQKKCLGKMGEVATEGRTVFFVSHSMASVKALCGQGLLLDKGNVIEKGIIDRVINIYTGNIDDSSRSLSARPRKDCSNRIRIKEVRLLPPKYFGDSLSFSIFVSFNEKITKFSVEWFMRDNYGQKVMSGLSSLQSGIWFSPSCTDESGEIICTLPNWCFAQGTYYLSVMLTIPYIECFDYLENAHVFTVAEMMVGKSGFVFKPDYGYVLPPVEWGVGNNLVIKKEM